MLRSRTHATSRRTEERHWTTSSMSHSFKALTAHPMQTGITREMQKRIPTEIRRFWSEKDLLDINTMGLQTLLPGSFHDSQSVFENVRQTQEYECLKLRDKIRNLTEQARDKATRVLYQMKDPWKPTKDDHGMIGRVHFMTEQ